MELGRIGIWLLAVGFAIVAAGYLLMVLAIPNGNLVAGIGIVVIAAGAAALCVAPRPPFTGRIARLGLGTLAAGAACLEVASVIAAGMTFDPLESMPVVVFGLIGLALTPIGVLLTLFALVRRFASRS
ncbi:MAG: hypothetical protein HY264_01285 [Chloroflexi bacterium]|nr:hypothetical protein [Chloroflexota bacterium]